MTTIHTPTCFVSYAREDAAFVRAVGDELIARGSGVWVDYDGIRAATDWRASIRRAVESSEAFVAVLSPDLVASGACRYELDCAVAANKRVIPVLWRDVEGMVIPDALAAPHWIVAAGSDQSVPEVCAQIVTALETDIEHLEEHTRLTTRAADWDRGGRDPSGLIRGRELADAEIWLNVDKLPAPTVVQRELVAASRQVAARRQRRLVLVLGVALIAAAALVAVAVRQRDVARQRTAESESRRLAGLADDLADRDVELAELVALDAVKQAPTAEADRALRRAVASDDLRWTAASAARYRAMAWQPDPPGSRRSSLLAVADRGGGLTLVSAATGHVSARLKSASVGTPTSVFWVDRGRGIVVAGTRATFSWDVTIPTRTPVQIAPRSATVSVSSDSRRLLISGEKGLVVMSAANHRIVGRLRAGSDWVDEPALSESGDEVAFGRLVGPANDLHTILTRWDLRTGRVHRLNGRVDRMVGYSNLARTGPGELDAHRDGKLVAWPAGRRVPTQNPVDPGHTFDENDSFIPSPRAARLAFVPEFSGVVDVFDGYDEQHAVTSLPRIQAVAVGDTRDSDFGSLAVAGADGAVQVFSGDTSTKRLLEVDPSGVDALAWSPDQRSLAVLNGAGRLAVWSRPPRRTAPDSRVSLVLSRDNRYVATTTRRTVTVRDTRTLRALRRYVRRAFLPVAFVAGGPLLLVEHTPDVARGPGGLFGHTSGTVVTPTETGEGGASLAVLDERGQHPISGRYDRYTVSPDATSIIAAAGAHGYVVDLTSTRLSPRRLPLSLGDSAFLQIGPRGRYVAALTQVDGTPYADVYDVLRRRRFRLARALRAAFSPTGHLLAVVDPGHRVVRVIDLPSQRVVHRFSRLSPVNNVGWSHDGRRLIAVGNAVFSSGGSGLFVIPLTGTATAVALDQAGAQESIGLSPDDRYAVSADDDGVTLWNAGSGDRIASWRLPLASNATAAILPDGRHVITKSERRVVLFDCEICSSLAVAETAARTNSAARVLTSAERSRYHLGR